MSGGRASDWWCKNCNFKVFGSKPRCFGCSAPNPEFKQQEKTANTTKPGDWMCPVCHINNFASRGSCFKCNTPKSKFELLFSPAVSPSVLAPALPAPAPPIAEDDSKMCAICIEKPSSYAFVDCGHFCTCDDCSKDLVNCPMCRKHIISRIRIYG
jgi:hypothetical protein